MKLHGDKMAIPDEPRNLKILRGIAKNTSQKNKNGVGVRNSFTLSKLINQYRQIRPFGIAMNQILIWKYVTLTI